MAKIFAIIMVCFGCLITTNVLAEYDEDVAALNKGMPKQVKMFNKRQIECNHWAGEEPYDKARAEEISATVQKLKCSALENEEKKLLKKYKSRSDVINSIHKAKEFY